MVEQVCRDQDQVKLRVAKYPTYLLLMQKYLIPPSLLKIRPYLHERCNVQFSDCSIDVYLLATNMRQPAILNSTVRTNCILLTFIRHLDSKIKYPTYRFLFGSFHDP